jgi:SAM-dependent MidA family methyltransferase
MVGVWAMCLWEQMGRPKQVNLVELGPGRGTLMADLLRVYHHNSDDTSEISQCFKIFKLFSFY